MKVASWNVNSVRVRVEQVVEWLSSEQPDVLGLQEIKMQTDDFPAAAFAEIGYQSVANGQKTYNGVALLYKESGADFHLDLPDFEDPQKRAIAGTFNGCRVINLYVPNGQAVGADKYAYKLDWLAALEKWLAVEMATHEKVVVMGDFNIAPDDRDVHDPAEWQDKILCSEPERAALTRLLDLGLQDSFRLFDQAEESFSWWDYRAAGFRRNRGLRIDLLLASQAVADSCVQSFIDKEPRTLERPSDHAPVWLEF
jgi:exodeoxyribonuclease-3